MTNGERRRDVRRQYERWPYPHVPMLGAVPRHHTWQLSADFLWDRCGTGEAPREPRIWIAGCGTMQPYVFRLANPRAEIVATDVSERSLDIARRRCLWHGQYGVRFGYGDLTDPSTCPEGPFDVIECYGVLMNLDDPGAALRTLASRLSENGVLRIMAYPHYGRRRIFQVQRVAKLCGLRFDRPHDPGRLRALIARLPEAHPLRYAFDTYADARNDAGLVDGFLHAGDRGFRGMELGALCEAAELSPAFWFHRDWARPDVMAHRLGLDHASQFFVAHYLDLWQELRGNFVVCLVRDRERADASTETRLHPAFAMTGATHPLDLFARVGRRLIGTTAPNRLGDRLRVSASELRQAAADPDRLPETARRRLTELGVLIGERRTASPLRPFGGRFDHGAEPRREVGEQPANPFYGHLFEAWRCGPAQTDGWLPELAEQLSRWRTEADPLEARGPALGLTPFGTHERCEDTVDAWLETATTRGLCESWKDWCGTPPNARALVFELTDGIVDLAHVDDEDVAELWNLTGTWNRLRLD